LLRALGIYFGQDTSDYQTFSEIRSGRRSAERSEERVEEAEDDIPPPPPPIAEGTSESTTRRGLVDSLVTYLGQDTFEYQTFDQIRGGQLVAIPASDGEGTSTDANSAVTFQGILDNLISMLSRTDLTREEQRLFDRDVVDGATAAGLGLPPNTITATQPGALMRVHLNEDSFVIVIGSAHLPHLSAIRDYYSEELTNAQARIVILGNSLDPYANIGISLRDIRHVVELRNEFGDLVHILQGDRDDISAENTDPQVQQFRDSLRIDRDANFVQTLDRFYQLLPLISVFYYGGLPVGVAGFDPVVIGGASENELVGARITPRDPHTGLNIADHLRGIYPPGIEPTSEDEAHLRRTIGLLEDAPIISSEMVNQHAVSDDGSPQVLILRPNGDLELQQIPE
jgi:hypothetical protein